jgi:hypothetical protein
MKKVLLAVVILITLVIASCNAKTESVSSNDSTSVDSVKVSTVDTVKVVK